MAPNSSTVTVTWHDPNTDERQSYSGSLPISFGRHSDNDVTVLSSSISRKHALLKEEHGQIVVENLSQANKTWIDGQPVTSTALPGHGLFEIRPFLFQIYVENGLNEGGNGSKAFDFDEDDTVISADDIDFSHRHRSPEEQPPDFDRVTLQWSKPGTLEPAERMIELPVRIGREADNDLMLSGDNISRSHARLEKRDDQLWIVDNGSSNGTFVNEERREAVALNIGDTVRIGEHQLTIQAVSKAPAERLPADEQTLVAGATLHADVEHRGADQAGPQTKGYTRRAPKIFDDDNTLIFHEETDDLTAALPSIQSDFPPRIFRQPTIPIIELQRAGIPTIETTYLAIGGGLGSFIWVDNLIIYGANPKDIISIGFEPKPYGRYRRLCSNSQIPEYERLRSNSDSCPDNIWGWPGYAVREAWHEITRGNWGEASRVLWQIFGEPTFSETYTPKSGNVFDSIDREAARINWKNIWRHGRVKAIRKTDDGRYVVAYSQVGKDADENPHRFVIASYLHLSIGYPAIKLLPDLYEYRQKTEDFKTVVNAYEEHSHVYEQLKRKGGIALVRGRGIVASRILQRLYELRANDNAKVAILHLMRTPVSEGAIYKRAQRLVKNHWEFQPFNWPKACWGGDLRFLLENANPVERSQLLNDWGGTTTADRIDWQEIIEQGLAEGWYRREFGSVDSVEWDSKKGKIVTVIQGRDEIQSQTQLEADFVIDATGLESKVEAHPLLKDMLEKYQLERNPLGRLQVTNGFEIEGMRNKGGRVYAAGVMTLGGPYAAVDSFLGLQYSAQRAVDNLVAAKAPGLKYLDGIRSFKQWVRWARGVHP